MFSFRLGKAGGWGGGKAGRGGGMKEKTERISSPPKHPLPWWEMNDELIKRSFISCMLPKNLIFT